METGRPIDTEGRRTEVPDIMPLKGRSRGALVIRHAARTGGEIALKEDGLTPIGREKALELGRRLSGHVPLRLFSSPVDRCVETAELIARGAGYNADVIESSRLGKPGPFVVDEGSVDRYLENLGLMGLAREWMEGKVPTDVMIPIPEGSYTLVRWISDQLVMSDEGLDIYIGHDLFLTPILMHFLGYDALTNGLLRFLDGFTLVRENGATVLAYNGMRTIV